MIIQNGTTYWTPIFDEEKFLAGFENHNHFRKITKKLTNGSVNTNGVRYIGDGSWGVPLDPCPP